MLQDVDGDTFIQYRNTRRMNNRRKEVFCIVDIMRVPNNSSVCAWSSKSEESIDENPEKQKAYLLCSDRKSADGIGRGIMQKSLQLSKQKVFKI